MSTCIDLRRQFGDCYRMRHEDAQHGKHARTEDPWLMVIACRNGHIGPWGGTTLVACTDRSGPVAKRLKSLPFAQVAQDGDDGVNVLFDVAHFDEVAQIMRPLRKYRVSKKEANRRAERVAKYQFSTA